jgi:hypothetical protein
VRSGQWRRGGSACEEMRVDALEQRFANLDTTASEQRAHI